MVVNVRKKSKQGKRSREEGGGGKCCNFKMLIHDFKDIK